MNGQPIGLDWILKIGSFVDYLTTISVGRSWVAAQLTASQEGLSALSK
jgi:hypothetical protein